MSHLHVVDTETGEIPEGCESCALLREQLGGAEREIRAWRTRYAKATRDTKKRAHEHELWHDCHDLFRTWKRECNHPQSKFTVERFEMAVVYLEEYGMKVCRRAIAGMAYDPFITARKNGSEKRHDGWHLIFDRGADMFEEYVNKAPREKGPDEVLREATTRPHQGTSESAQPEQGTPEQGS